MSCVFSIPKLDQAFHLKMWNGGTEADRTVVGDSSQPLPEGIGLGSRPELSHPLSTCGAQSDR